MTLEMKHCGGCDTDKDLMDFYFHKSGKAIGKPHSRCIKCENESTRNWRKLHLERAKTLTREWRKSNPEKVRIITRAQQTRRGVKPAAENKSCALYLGCVISETVLSREFPGFKRMPLCNPDYDYECPQGFLIDVKSSCRYQPKRGNEIWTFHINGNKKAHFFICIAWKDRKSLVPEHLWLIPGWGINEKSSFAITDSVKSLNKWSKYERSLKNVLKCCNELRGDKILDPHTT